MKYLRLVALKALQNKKFEDVNHEIFRVEKLKI